MSTGVGIFKSGTPELIGIGIDLRLSENHTAEAQITSQPIEDGSIVSDHIILQPDVVEIIAEMSNFDGNGSQSVGERATTAWLEFKRAIQSRTLFDVVTHHELYESMAFESLGGEHAAPYTGRLTLKVTFRKIDSTQLGIVAAPESQLAGDVAKAGSSEVDGGRQVKKDVSGLEALFDAQFTTGLQDGSVSK